MLPDVGDVRNAAECDKESIKACVEEEENEVLVVSKSNTVPNPWTVVIHLQHALRILKLYIVPCTLHVFILYTSYIVHVAHCTKHTAFWIKDKPIRLEYGWNIIITVKRS